MGFSNPDTFCGYLAVGECARGCRQVVLWDQAEIMVDCTHTTCLSLCQRLFCCCYYYSRGFNVDQAFMYHLFDKEFTLNSLTLSAVIPALHICESVFAKHWMWREHPTGTEQEKISPEDLTYWVWVTENRVSADSVGLRRTLSSSSLTWFPSLPTPLSSRAMQRALCHFPGGE